MKGFLIGLIFLSTSTLYAAIIPVNVQPSKLNVLIDSTDLECRKLKDNKYLINNSFYLSPVFLNGNFNKVITELNSLNQSKTIMLDYVAIGNGLRMITNIVITD